MGDYGSPHHRRLSTAEDPVTSKPTQSSLSKDPDAALEPKADVEVVNNTDEPVQVKVFELTVGGHASRFFRSALGEATISGGQNRVFLVKATPGPNSEEAAFEVEI